MAASRGQGESWSWFFVSCFISRQASPWFQERVKKPGKKTELGISRDHNGGQKWGQWTIESYMPDEPLL